MKASKFLLTALISLASTTLAIADERPEHYKGLPAETLGQALENLSEYNPKLAALLAQESLTSADLHKVHELTYTLENALGKINAELSDTLEAVHVASEHGDAKTVKAKGKAYLDNTEKVLK